MSQRKATEQKLPLRRRVEVTWRDSASRGGWDPVEYHRKQCGVGPVYSVGYLLQATKRVVQLAQSQSAMSGHVTDTITIPRENVIKLRTLK